MRHANHRHAVGQSLHIVGRGYEEVLEGVAGEYLAATGAMQVSPRSAGRFGVAVNLQGQGWYGNNVPGPIDFGVTMPQPAPNLNGIGPLPSWGSGPTVAPQAPAQGPTPQLPPNPVPVVPQGPTPSFPPPGGGVTPAPVPSQPSSYGGGGPAYGGQPGLVPRPLRDFREFPLGFFQSGIGPGTGTVEVISRPQIIFRGERLVIPAVVGANFSLIDIKIGNRSQLVNSTALPAAVFAENAIGIRLSLDTAAVAQDIALSVQNTAATQQTFQAALIGTAAQ